MTVEIKRIPTVMIVFNVNRNLFQILGKNGHEKYAIS